MYVLLKLFNLPKHASRPLLRSRRALVNVFAAGFAGCQHEEVLTRTDAHDIQAKPRYRTMLLAGAGCGLLNTGPCSFSWKPWSAQGAPADEVTVCPNDSAANLRRGLPLQNECLSAAFKEVYSILWLYRESHVFLKPCVDRKRQ